MPHVTRAFPLLVVLALAPCLLPAQSTRPVRPSPHAAARIPARELRRRLAIFADDSMFGREAGQLGNVKATRYLAAEAHRLGLSPAGENGSYFQSVPLVARQLDGGAVLTADADSLIVGRDFVFLPQVAPHSFDTARVVFGGRLGDTSVALDPRETSGRFLILMPGPLNSNPAILAASVVAVVAPDGLDAEQVRTSFTPVDYLPGWTALGKLPDVLMLTPAAATRLLGSEITKAAPHALGRMVHDGLRYHELPPQYPARNVIGILPGRDPKLSHEYVAIGAHSDHLGIRRDGPVDHDSVYLAHRIPPLSDPASPAFRRALDSLRRTMPDRPDSIYNGADDDGSGAIALLEIASYFARSHVRPRRSLLFVWHTAEEEGLLGSRWYADHPTVSRDSIVADIDVDMIGRGGASDSREGGPAYLMTVGARRLSSELGDVLDRVNASERRPFHIDLQYDAPGHPDQLYCRSDHVNYARYGIPSVAISTGIEPDYHELTDEVQEIDFAHYQAVTEFLADLARAVGDLDRRPTLDHPKPDPAAPCRQ